MVRKFVKSYSTLFNQEDEEDSEEREERGTSSSNEGSNNEFGKKWRWVRLIDRVSETSRCSWDYVYSMNIFEFFNILCYSIDKANEEKRQLDLWKRKN